jgi:hypothetical protein
MQWILSVFAMYYNIIHKIHGHVWQGRFWSGIINGMKQFIAVFNYISENPVKKEMVQNAGEYRFGGLYFILKGIFDIVKKPDNKGTEPNIQGAWHFAAGWILPKNKIYPGLRNEVKKFSVKKVKNSLKKTNWMTDIYLKWFLMQDQTAT